MTATASARVLPRVRAVSRAALYWRFAVGFVALISALIEFRVLQLGGFALDDFRNIGQARAGLSVHLLVEPVGGTHFQPVTRFLQWLTATPLHTSYTGTALVLSVLCGLGTYWLVRLLDTLWGARLLHLVIGFLFGTSCVLIVASQWVASAATSTVAVYFAAGACLGFVRWLPTGSRSSYAFGLVAAAVAIGSWEQALATPVIITLIWACFARDWQPMRRAVLAQLPFYAIALAYVIYVELQLWHQSLQLPTVGYWLLLLVVMVGRDLSASVIGTNVPSGAQSFFDWFSAVVVVVAFAGGALWLGLRRRLAWLALVVFGAGTVVASIPVAAGRSFIPATVAATTPRYVTFLPLLLAVAVGGAARPRHAHDGLVGASSDYSVRTAADDAWRRAWSPKSVAWTVAVALGCVGYLINLSHTFSTTEFSIQMGRSGSGNANHIGTGIAALGRAGRRSLVDAIVPYPVWYPANDGSGRLSTLLPFWSTNARAFGEGRIAGIDKTGVVRWASFHAGAAGAQYARVIVRTPIATTMIVRIAAVNPIQPETPWRISIAPGTHSFTLATWSTTVRTISVTGRQVRVVGLRTGTISLGSPVASTPS